MIMSIGSVNTMITFQLLQLYLQKGSYMHVQIIASFLVNDSSMLFLYPFVHVMMST